jgi:hypothetical protein
MTLAKISISLRVKLGITKSDRVLGRLFIVNYFVFDRKRLGKSNALDRDEKETYLLFFEEFKTSGRREENENK